MFFQRVKHGSSWVLNRSDAALSAALLRIMTKVRPL